MIDTILQGTSKIAPTAKGNLYPRPGLDNLMGMRLTREIDKIIAPVDAAKVASTSTHVPSLLDNSHLIGGMI